MVEIIPAILEETSEEFERKFRLIESYTDRIHLDITDGTLTSTKTITGYDELIKVPSDTKWDIHLMIRFPENIMEKWYKTSADRFIFHSEANHALRGLIEGAHLNGRKAGVALNPETQIESVDEILEFVDFVHFLTVHPGAQGSQFQEEVVNKIAMFHEQHPEIKVSVDGHVDPQTGPRLAIAGASELIVGSYIVDSDNVAQAFENLKFLKNFGG